MLGGRCAGTRTVGDDEVEKTKRLAHYIVVDQNATVQGARGRGVFDLQCGR